MSKPESHELVLHIQSGQIEDYRKVEQEKFISNYPANKIQEGFEKLQLSLDDISNPILKKGIYSGFLGALYAFLDRDLDPLHREHHALFGIIRQDIEKAFIQVSQGEIDEEIWLFETFDYGIKHVYYLDWQLYLSKTCY